MSRLARIESERNGRTEEDIIREAANSSTDHNRLVMCIREAAALGLPFHHFTGPSVLALDRLWTNVNEDRIEHEGW